MNNDEIENNIISKFHKGMETGIPFNGKKGRDNGQNKKADQRKIEWRPNPPELPVIDDPQEKGCEHDQSDKMGDRYRPYLDRAASKGCEDK